MKVLMLEIRDVGTFIPAIAVVITPRQLNTAALYLFRRAGWGTAQTGIYLVKMATGGAEYDPYEWDNRTMQAAHLYIEKNWDKLKDGDVIDCEFIMGLTKEPKQSESVESPL